MLLGTVLFPINAQAQTVSTVAGNGTADFKGDGAAATAAELNSPGGVFVDAAGNIYITDRENNRIRKVDVSTGYINTVAGGGTSGLGDGGLATNAQLGAPRSNVFVDSAGNIFIADSGHSTLRKVDAATHDINELPGTVGGSLWNPITVFGDSLGNLFVSNQWNSNVLEWVAATQTLKTAAGNGNFFSSGDGGPATSASIADPVAVVVDPCDNIVIADDISNVIRVVDAGTGIIRTVAGTGGGGYTGDGGPATSATFYAPYGVLLDASANIFISDTLNQVIRKVAAATGKVTTVAGDGTGSGTQTGAFKDGPALQAEFNAAVGLAEDPRNGNLLVADEGNNRIRLVTGVLASPVTPRACLGSIGTTTKLTSSLNPAAPSQLVTFTAVVSPAAGGPPTGNVIFEDNGAALGTVAVDAGGSAEYSTSSLSVSSHSMTANYMGDLNHLTSTGSFTQTVSTTIAAVTTGTVTSITTSGATVGGDVTRDGGATVTARGICWGAAANPAVGGACKTDPAAGTGVFSDNITGLAPGTPYHVRAWATNSAGTVYGNDVTFRTAIPITSPVLSITKTHAGCFTQGQSGTTYTLVVSNASGAVSTSGTVTVQDTLPTGLTLVSMSGTGWNCAANTCTRSNALAGGSSYPAITVTLNVAGNAPLQMANQAAVSGGGTVSTSYVTTMNTVVQFNDVSPNATYCDAADLMSHAGVTTGCVQGTTPQTRSYCPDNDVTRQEMAAFIVRAATGTTNPAIYNTTPYFQDVPITNNFFPHIQKLMELGITTGCSQSPALYCPTDTIPRWEMAIFMVRARLALHGATFSSAATPYFTDVPTNVEGNGQPFPFVQRSFEEHITNGCGGTLYCPDEVVTRGQMASFIMRGLFNETMVLAASAPMLTGVSPNALPVTLGSQITVTIAGVNTTFQSGDTVTVPSGMLTVSNVVVNSATSISATLTTNSTTVAAPQALVVTTGGQNLTLPLAIKVGTY
ncbi:MAG: Ig-like domain repeat protein [Bryobacteraceae bacterium]|jgi:hypothetical protein